MMRFEDMINKTVSLLIDRIQPYEPEKIILFGSTVRGESSPDSDIDLAIIKSTNQPFYQRNRDVRKLLRSKIPLDVFVFTPEEFERTKTTNQFIAEIARTGKIIYEQPIK